MCMTKTVVTQFNGAVCLQHLPCFCLLFGIRSVQTNNKEAGRYFFCLDHCQNISGALIGAIIKREVDFFLFPGKGG